MTASDPIERIAPADLADLVGQEAATGILRAALREGRVKHAYLFTGPDAVGKLTAALLFAAALNCQDTTAPEQACGVCASCVRFRRGSHPQIWRIAPMYRRQPITDPRLLELVEDQAWITIAQTRGGDREGPPHPPILREAARRPIFSPYKVFILEPAERMTEEAADSMLAALEEPPPHTVFILVSARPAAMRPTVVSRCEQVRFHTAPPARIEELLLRQGVPGEQAQLIARLADGRPGRAVTMAQRPYLLQLRGDIMDLADAMFDAPLPAALMLSARTQALAQRLWELEYESIVEQEREEQPEQEAAEAEAMRISRTRAMRRAAPAVLEMMVAWLRDIMVVGSDPDLMIHRDCQNQAAQRAERMHREHLRPAIEAILRTADYLRGYANLDAALEGMYIELAGIFAGAQPRR